MAKRSAGVVAEVSIYGTSRVGHGYIVRLADGRMFGTGEVREGRSATEALWLAMDEVTKAGTGRTGTVLVHIDTVDGRPLQAALRASDRPYFGELTWSDGPVYVLSSEALKAAQEAR